MKPEEAERLTRDFHQRCGEILRMAAGVESALEFFLMQYFIRPQNKRSFFFRDEVLSRLSFRFKIELFKTICRELKIEKSRLDDIDKKINYVRKIRNSVAHHEALIEDWKNGIKIYAKRATRFIRKEDKLTLTDELVKQIDEKRLAAIQGINGVYLELEKLEKEVDEEPVI